MRAVVALSKTSAPACSAPTKDPSAGVAFVVDSRIQVSFATPTVGNSTSTLAVAHSAIRQPNILEIRPMGDKPALYNQGFISSNQLFQLLRFVQDTWTSPLSLDKQFCHPTLLAAFNASGLKQP